jgi:hypothetical protein
MRMLIAERVARMVSKESSATASRRVCCAYVYRAEVARTLESRKRSGLSI